MEARIVPRDGKDVLQLDHVVILPGRWRNFSGAANECNAPGFRNFTVAIDPEYVDMLLDAGLNVKPKNYRGEEIFVLKIKVNYYERDGYKLHPTIYLQSGKNRVKLGEEDVYLLDRAYLIDASMDCALRPWKNANIGTGEGITVYLSSMLAVQEVNRFDDYIPEDELAPAPFDDEEVF